MNNRTRSWELIRGNPRKISVHVLGAGKHPAWNDHIKEKERLGDGSQNLSAFLKLFYWDGLSESLLRDWGSTEIDSGDLVDPSGFARTLIEGKEPLSQWLYGRISNNRSGGSEWGSQLKSALRSQDEEGVQGIL